MTSSNCPVEIRKSVHRRIISTGFTLVEITIVIATIGILVAIAIPRFADYQQRSHNAAALSDLRNVRTILEAYYQEYQRFP